MKYARDTAVLAATALLTALLAVPLLGPGPARAEEGLVPLRKLTANPTLEASGVSFFLKPAKTALAAKDKPVLILTATAGKEAAKTEITVRLRTTLPSSPMARMLVLPVEAFTKTIPMALKPGEKKTIRIETGVAVAAGSTFTIELQSGKQRLSSSPYAVPALVLNVPGVTALTSTITPEPKLLPEIVKDPR